MTKRVSRRPAGLQQLRSKGALGLVAGLIALGFIGSLVVFNDPVSNSSNPVPTAKPTPTPTQIAVDRGETTCRPSVPAGVEELVAIDGSDGWKILSGDGELTQSADSLGDGASMEVDNGSDPEDLWVELEFAMVRDLSGAKRFFFPVRQNGNIFSSAISSPWRFRFRTAGDHIFERRLPARTVGAANAWCVDSSKVSDWIGSEGADWSGIAAVQVMVPAYAGSGAGNKIAFDDIQWAS